MPAQVFCQQVSERGHARHTVCRKKSQREGDCFVVICFFFSFRMVSLCSRQCVSGHLLYGDCFKTVCSAFIFFQDRMEHHGYACIDISLVNSTSLFPSGARREQIELTLVSYSKPQIFHAVSVKAIYRSWFQVSSQVTKSSRR